MVNYAQQLGLGKFDPIGRARAVGQHKQNMDFNEQTMDIRGLQFEQDQIRADKQKVVDENIEGAVLGDPKSMLELFKANPQLGQAFEQRQNDLISSYGRERANTINQKTVPFLMKLKKTPPEQRKELLEQALADDDIDFDNEDAQAQVFAGDDSMIDIALYGMLGDKAYSTVMSSDKAKFEQGTGDMTGYAFDPNTGEYKINESLKNRIDEAMQNRELPAKERQSINKEITNLSKETKMIANTTNALMKLSEIVDKDGNISGPSSIAMVFKFMKALDPTSVVREGEFATAENSAGVDERVRNMYNKLFSGGRLGKEQVTQFLNTAKGLANSAIKASNAEVNKYFDTFEDTLPSNFVKLTKKRIPDLFEMEPTEQVSEPPPLLPTATGANGEKVILKNGEWVPYE